MIGLVLVTHGKLAQEFISAMEHVVGPQENVTSVCIGPDDDMEKRRKEIIESVAKVDKGKGVAILTDMFGGTAGKSKRGAIRPDRRGGTPSNRAIPVLHQGKVEVIAGVNLPMLIKLASLRGSASLTDAVAQAQEAGRKYINVASQLLADENVG